MEPAVLSVVLVSVEPVVGCVDVRSAGASLEGLTCESLSLFRRFLVRSSSVRLGGSNDADRTSEGHVALVVMRSMSEPTGTSLIYTTDRHTPRSIDKVGPFCLPTKSADKKRRLVKQR